MSAGRPHHYGHFLQVKKKSLQPLDFIHDLINVYSRRSGADNPGTKILMSTETSCHFGHLLQVSIRAVAGQHSSPELSFANKTKMFFWAENKRRKITGPWNIGHCDQIYFEVKDTAKVWHSSIKKYLRYKAKSLDREKIGYCDLHIFWSKVTLLWLIITQYDSYSSNTI